jgi:glycosyltransferase involved in cell wall biosynthesis
MGDEVAVAFSDGSDARPLSTGAFKPVTYGAAAELRFADGRGADLVHAWTPRQLMAETTRRLCTAHGCPYVVHLEDNEHVVAAAHLGLSVEELLTRANADPNFDVPDHLSHPVDMRNFLESAAGVTVLMDRLLEFKPSRLPGLEIWPAAEDVLFYPQETDPALRASLGIRDSAKVLTYHGNVHRANAAEVCSLYLAVGALARDGVDVVLVRLGEDYSEFLPMNLPEIQHFVVKLPFQPRKEIPRYLALADVFVQPGRADDFNNYRFPSKLPEFFAMGRPVILPATNIGLKVKPGEEALLLHRGDALEIAEALRRVLSDTSLLVRLGAGARRFYERTLNWDKSAKSLRCFYERVLNNPRFDDLGNDVALRRIAKHYEDFKAGLLGYATVKDYSDGVDRLRALATINRDLKDAQRPWVFKAILGAVPPGGRLLEIGAGDPWVADLLSRLGYEVVVVDPYDGRDGGPNQFEQIKARFPRVTFLRGLFPQAVSILPDAKFDCIYSISVLEHLADGDVQPLFAAIAANSRTPASPTIHSVDHVLLGNGAAEHLSRLRLIVNCLGFEVDDLSVVLARLECDPDTYFLSAEAHNRWRGATSYAEFPMRRCVSIQICCPAGRIRRENWPPS